MCYWSFLVIKGIFFFFIEMASLTNLHPDLHLQSRCEQEVRLKLMFARYQATGSFVTSSKASTLYHNSAHAIVTSADTERVMQSSVYVYPMSSYNDSDMHILAHVASYSPIAND